LVGTISILSIFLSLIIGYSFICQNWVGQELHYAWQEFSRLRENTNKLITQLSLPQKAFAIALLILIVLVRGFYFWRYPLTTDEVASFDFFVREGSLAVVGFYPIPNNHIFSNLLSLLFYQVNNDPLWVMRLPAFLVSLAGTGIMYVVLIRYGGFFSANLTIGMLSFSQMGIYYAIGGRGYFLLTLHSFVGFFSVLNLMYKLGNQRLYLFLIIITGILGFYTVPTFLYPFTSTLVIGFFYFCYKKEFDKVVQIFFCGLIVCLGTILLYLPVIFISGPDALFNNGYIQPLASASFWAGFLQYFAYTEGMLIGQERLGKYILTAIFLLSFVGIFFTKESKAFLKIGLPALIMVVLPYLFLIMQRVYPPERVLFYKAIFAYFMISFLLFWVLQKMGLRNKGKLYLTAIIIGFYASYQIFILEKQMVPFQIASQQRIETFRWLIKHQPQNILVPDPFYSLYLNHYFKVAQLNCTVHSEKKLNQEFDFLILPTSRPVETEGFQVEWEKKVYQNNAVIIYDLRN
jgi:hypothetical protein